MLINLMDPALRIATGHHLDIDADVARELTRAGHDVHVYSHTDISADARGIIVAHAGLTPVFRVSPYIGPPGGNAAADETSAFTRAAGLLAEDLRRARRADLWIWPTLFASQHYACVIADPGIPIAGCIMVEPTYLDSAGRVLWRRSLAEAHSKKVRFALGILEPVLRDEYLPLTADGRLETLPFPFDRIHEPSPGKKLLTVGFFGNQRDEKGVALFGALIDKLLEHGFDIVLHDSSGCSEGQGNPRLRLVLGFVANLPAEIITCDLVVIPYRADEYKYKGSGIVWSALANGIPVVAPYGSAPGKFVEGLGAGKLFDAFTTESVLQAILDARNDYASISRAACGVSASWMKRHGVRKFVEAMLDMKT